MRSPIQPMKFYILGSIYFANFCLCMYFMISANVKNFAFLTAWTLLMNSVYLLLNLIADATFFFTSQDKFESLNEFSREKMAPVVNSFTYMVFIAFWGMTLMGDKVMKFPTDFASIIKNIYLHGLITVFVILDVFFYEHKKAKFDLINLVFIFIIFLLYATAASISIYAIGFIPYPFMVGATFFKLCLYGGILFLFVILGYLVHIGLNMIKYKFTKVNDEVITDNGVDTKAFIKDEV